MCVGCQFNSGKQGAPETDKLIPEKGVKMC